MSDAWFISGLTFNSSIRSSGVPSAMVEPCGEIGRQYKTERSGSTSALVGTPQTKLLMGI